MSDDVQKCLEKYVFIIVEKFTSDIMNNNQQVNRQASVKIVYDDIKDRTTKRSCIMKRQTIDSVIIYSWSCSYDGNSTNDDGLANARNTQLSRNTLDVLG